jgi:hypothetical protein
MAGTTPDRTLSIIYATGDTATVPEVHSRFDELVTLLLSGADDDEVSDLVDVMLAVTKRLEQLSERVSIRGRSVYFDGDQLRGELSDVLVELFEAGNPESLRPVVNFLEKAATNPSGKSIDDLYRWITKGDLIIHEDGDFLAYKGTRTGQDGLRTSISEGTAFVNGEEFTGHIPNPDGAVITMPRSDVDDDEGVACSTGLHAGTASYAFRFANDDTILVKINPRDVVSVPTDSSDQKLRVCRYVVHEVVEARQESRLWLATPWSDVATDEEDDYGFDEDGDEGDDYGYLTAEGQEAMYSDEALEALRQKLSGEDLEYQYSGLTEAQLEEQDAENTVIRDSKGRFTPESAVKAVRNSRGQFTKLP